MKPTGKLLFLSAAQAIINGETLIGKIGSECKREPKNCLNPNCENTTDKKSGYCSAECFKERGK